MIEVSVPCTMVTMWLTIEMLRMTAVESNSCISVVTWLTHVGQWRFGMRNDVWTRGVAGEANMFAGVLVCVSRR